MKGKCKECFDVPLMALSILLSCCWMVVPGVHEAWGQQAVAEGARAAESESQSAEDPESPGSFLDKITIHGYLSQAYAASDGHQIQGIPEDGTADYRTAALQVRADITEDDVFVVQLNHERNGLSPSQVNRQDVQLDWVFYQRKLGDSSIKVGRMPIPFGIYNEVRDVGTVLAFYRPALPLYEENSFTTETIDGVLLSHGFELGGGWHLDGNVHFGNWQFFDAQLNPVKSDNSLGIEFWLDTPVTGLRMGVGGLRYHTEGKTTPSSHRQLSHFSVEGDFGRLESEVEIKRDTAQLVSGGRLVSVWGGYGRLGFHLTGKLTLEGEYDFLNVKFPATDLAKDRDRILGLVYHFRPDLVLKAELHHAHGFKSDERPGLIPGRRVPDFKTEFGILSLSTSF